MAHADVIAALAALVPVGATSPDVVAVEARKIAAIRGPATTTVTDADEPPAGRERVISLTQRRLVDPAAVIAGLPPDSHPLPNVDAYDELLARRRPMPTLPHPAEQVAAGSTSKGPTT